MKQTSKRCQLNQSINRSIDKVTDWLFDLPYKFMKGKVNSSTNIWEINCPKVRTIAMPGRPVSTNTNTRAGGMLAKLEGIPGKLVIWAIKKTCDKNVHHDCKVTDNKSLTKVTKVRKYHLRRKWRRTVCPQGISWLCLACPLAGSTCMREGTAPCTWTCPTSPLTRTHSAEPPHTLATLRHKTATRSLLPDESARCTNRWRSRRMPPIPTNWPQLLKVYTIIKIGDNTQQWHLETYLPVPRTNFIFSQTLPNVLPLVESSSLSLSLATVIWNCFEDG